VAAVRSRVSLPAADVTGLPPSAGCVSRLLHLRDRAFAGFHRPTLGRAS
jgi:hypothetical protein